MMAMRRQPRSFPDPDDKLYEVRFYAENAIVPSFSYRADTLDEAASHCQSNKHRGMSAILRKRKARQHKRPVQWKWNGSIWVASAYWDRNNKRCWDTPEECDLGTFADIVTQAKPRRKARGGK